MTMNSDHRDSMIDFDCNCMPSAGQNYLWRRSVKRKLEDVGFQPGGASSNAEVENEEEDDLFTLRETLRSQHQALEALSSELEEERNASAVAATETMSMILRLQKEKSEVQMEASQFKRFAEGRFAHDQEELMALENLLYRKDQVIQALQCEVQSYKHRLLSIGFDEFENGTVRSPERSWPDNREDRLCFCDGCASRNRPFAGKLDGIDFYDGQTRDCSQRQHKEAKGRNICLDKSNEAAISWQPQQQWEDSFPTGIMQGQEIGYNNYHGVQSEEYSHPTQGEGCSLKERQIYNNSESDDAQKIAINAIEKSLADANLTPWECIEKLDDRLKMLEKMTRNHHLDNEWIATRKVLQKKLSAYSASLKEGTKSYRRLSMDGTGMSNSARGEADKDNLGENDSLTSVNVRGKWISEVSKINSDFSCSGKAAAISQPVDGITEEKYTLNDVYEVQNENASAGGCKALKGNGDWMKEPGLTPKRHEGDRSGRAPDLTERKGERNITLVNDLVIPPQHDTQISRTAPGVGNSSTVLPMELESEQVATKKVLQKKLTEYSSSLREGLKSHKKISTDSTGISVGLREEASRESSENYDRLTRVNFQGKWTPELSNTGVDISCSKNKATVDLPVDDVTDKTSSVNDVFEIQCDNGSSRGSKLLKGNEDWLKELDSSCHRHEGDIFCNGINLTETKTGENITVENERVTSLPAKLRAKPASEDGELKQLNLKLKVLEGERDSMKQAIQTLKREKAHLALLKEIAQQLCELQASGKSQKAVEKLPLQEDVSIFSIIKWILSYIFRRNKRTRQIKYMCGVSHNNVGLLFLLDNAPKRRLGTCITRLGM